jgi:hypothetical protein
MISSWSTHVRHVVVVLSRVAPCRFEGTELAMEYK